MNTAPNNKRIIINNAADVRTLIKMIDTWHESYDVAAIRVGRGSPVIIFTFSEGRRIIANCGSHSAAYHLANKLAPEYGHKPMHHHWF